jgi:hypothetical protein
LKHVQLTSLFIAVIACTVAVSSTDARMVFDGPWSVTIQTIGGSCSSGFEIHDGIVLGCGDANVRGRVARDGAVRVSVSSGDQYASGSGRLTPVFGSCVWRGRGSAGFCAGRWVAQRR